MWDGVLSRKLICLMGLCLAMERWFFVLRRVEFAVGGG